MTRQSIEQAIYQEYGITREALYSNVGGKEKAIVSTVRAVYWTILRENFGMRVVDIAEEFNRTARCIYKQVANLSWGIRNLSYYKSIAQKITGNPHR